MDGNWRDRIAQSLSQSRSRRRALGTIGVTLLTGVIPVKAATQIQVPTCGASGDVCTLMHGCCSGLTCATSYLNPSYGVCVTGSGGMAPVSDSIVVPESEGVETELAQEVSEAAAAASTTATTDPQAERKARIQTHRTNKDSRRSTQRTNKQTRADTRQSNKQTRRTTERTNAAPQISLEFFVEVPPVETSLADPLDTPPAAGTPTPTPTGKPEIVRMRNLTDVTITVSRIESIGQPDVFSTSSVSIAAGATQLFESGQYVPTRAASGTTIWTKTNVCPAGGGVNILAARSGSTVTHQLSVMCGGSASYGPTETVDTEKRKREKAQQQRDQQRRRKQHQKSQNRQQAKHQKGGKGR